MNAYAVQVNFSCSRALSEFAKEFTFQKVQQAGVQVRGMLDLTIFTILLVMNQLI